MSTIQALKKRALFVFRLVVAIFGKLCCCFRRRKNIAELPYTIHQTQTYFKSASNEEKWEGWNDTPFITSVEEKIIEYRRKKAESEVVAKEEIEVDYFSDMQPKVMQTLKAYIGNSDNTEVQSSNLFAVKTDEMLPPCLGELGTLEDTNTCDETEEWDNQVDIESINNILREQKAKEREERRLIRQMEHAKRFERRKQ
ncbi:putative receptor-binding cancer antigen [Dirofilaria immitis]